MQRSGHSFPLSACAASARRSALRVIRVAGASVAPLTLSVLTTACGRIPSPLAPQMHGSIGMPHKGVLTADKELPKEGDTWRWLRNDDHHHATPQFEALIERVAAKVAAERPGPKLVVGDISARGGGYLLPHFSHRAGRDGDLLLYMTTLDGVPVDSTGWVVVGADGLGYDKLHKRWLRFDVEREWLLIKALVTDSDARVQWIFSNRKLQALLLEYAEARGESWQIVARAAAVMLEPNPGGAHDDHVHVRVACLPEELATGCEKNGPDRPWFVAWNEAARANVPMDNVPNDDASLAMALFAPTLPLVSPLPEAPSPSSTAPESNTP